MQQGKRIRALLVWVTLVISLFIVLPVFAHTGIFTGHDMFLHVVYEHQFFAALQSGQFPVRVIDWIFPGYAQPLFTYYQPGFSYAISLLLFAGLSYRISLYLLLLILWALSGFFFFKYARFHMGFWGSLVGSVLYVFAPYHIVDIFVRAAFPEFAALTLAPLLFWSIERMAIRKTFGSTVLVAIIAALFILFHPPLFLIFSPLVLSYGLYFLWRKQRQQALSLAIGIVLGLGMSAFFLLPALLESSLVHMALATTGKVADFRSHFICYYQLFLVSWGYGRPFTECSNVMSFQIGILPLLGVGTAFAWIIRSVLVKEKSTKKVFVLVFLALFIFACFMTLRISRPVWDSIHVLSFLQFPWRFLSLAIFSAAFLGGFVFDKIPKYQPFLYSMFFLIVIFFSAAYINPEGYVAIDVNAVNPFAHEQYKVAQLLPEPAYNSSWVKRVQDPHFISFSNSILQDEDSPWTLLKESADEKIYSIDIPAKKDVTLFVPYLPQWNVFIDGKISRVQVDDFGYMHIVLSKGHHVITVRFVQTVLEQVSNWISGLLIAGCLIFLFSGRVLRYFRTHA